MSGIDPNVLLLGPPGVGKTSASTSCAPRICSRICAVPQAEHRLDSAHARVPRPEAARHRRVRRLVLRIASRATALFSLISARYERGSIILTSNKGFGEWSEVLGDAVISTAILDRLLHHSHILNIRGKTPPNNSCRPFRSVVGG